ncbi:MarR family transcriptional regulator [Nocardioides nanhaiensis]|uniref:HTH marR-type domain-containing protein n=1 Tax=Nocardioides nanhaiensis TaxID=1476871 RepID=A0ABP8WW53_9ACTN
MRTLDSDTRLETRLDTVAELGHQLLRLQRRRTTVPPGTRLEVSAFRILWVLAHDGPATLRSLAEQLDLEQSTVNRQVHAALDAGWLEECPAPPRAPGSSAASGRARAARHFRPTRAGRTAYEHDGRLRAERYLAALDRLGTDRATRLVEDLTAFNDAWDAAGQP